MEKQLQAAEAAVAFAQHVRSYHRRTTPRGNARREEDIQIALDRIRDAMKPLRSAIARFPYAPQGEIAHERRKAIRAASASLQSERRKLWKMRAR